MFSVQIEPFIPLTSYSPLTEAHVTTAIRRALNKTARWLQIQVARQTAQDLKLPVSTVKHQLQRASGQQLVVALTLSQHAGVIAAVKLGLPRQTRQGIRTNRWLWEHSFMATMPSGHQGVFKRQGKARLPIIERQLVLTGRIKQAMSVLADKQAMRYFDKVFAHELDFVLRQWI